MGEHYIILLFLRGEALRAEWQHCPAEERAPFLAMLLACRSAWVCASRLAGQECCASGSRQAADASCKSKTCYRTTSRWLCFPLLHPTLKCSATSQDSNAE